MGANLTAFSLQPVDPEAILASEGVAPPAEDPKKLLKGQHPNAKKGPKVDPRVAMINPGPKAAATAVAAVEKDDVPCLGLPGV